MSDNPYEGMPGLEDRWKPDEPEPKSGDPTPKGKARATPPEPKWSDRELDQWADEYFEGDLSKIDEAIRMPNPHYAAEKEAWDTQGGPATPMVPPPRETVVRPGLHDFYSAWNTDDYVRPKDLETEFKSRTVEQRAKETFKFHEESAARDPGFKWKHLSRDAKAWLRTGLTGEKDGQSAKPTSAEKKPQPPSKPDGVPRSRTPLLVGTVIAALLVVLAAVLLALAGGQTDETADDSEPPGAADETSTENEDETDGVDDETSEIQTAGADDETGSGADDGTETTTVTFPGGVTLEVTYPSMPTAGEPIEVRGRLLGPDGTALAGEDVFFTIAPGGDAAGPDAGHTSGQTDAAGVVEGNVSTETAGPAELLTAYQDLVESVAQLELG